MFEGERSVNEAIFRVVAIRSVHSALQFILRVSFSQSTRGGLVQKVVVISKYGIGIYHATLILVILL